MRDEYVDRWSTGRYYSLEYNHRDELCVVGNLDVYSREYDPLEVMPEIVLELLRIGLKHEKHQDYSRDVQSFCNRFGMLDFEDALVEKTYDDKSVKFYAGNVLGRKAATQKKYINLFRLFPKEQRLQSRRVNIQRVDELPPQGDGEPVLHPDYLDCEAVEWYGRYGLQLYDLMRRAQAGEDMVLLHGNVELRYEFRGGIGRRRVWYDSLKSLVDFCMMEMLTCPKPALRLCKHCGAPLLTHGTRAEYCSASCRNVENVSRSRKRRSDTPE